VCTVELGCPVNLEKICHSGYKFVEHTKGKKFTEVVTLGLPGKSCCRIFKNGKMVCMGETSNEEAKLSACRFARIIQKMGYEVVIIKLIIYSMWWIDVQHNFFTLRRPNSETSELWLWPQFCKWNSEFV